ncbi:MAG: SDR family oxidoreductase [Patescibacteria group bacterium]
MAKVLVTGGAGFIGSNLVDALINEGHQARIIDNLSTGKKENLNPKADFFEADLRDYAKIRPVFEGVDFVFHEAALPRIQYCIEQPKESNDVNVGGALNALLASKEAGVKKFIYAASSSAYGNQPSLPLKETMACSPLNPYALQKYVGELYCKIFWEIYKLPTVCLRYFNVYGPRASQEGAYALVIGAFLSQKKESKSLTITGDGEQSRDFTWVFDIVRANLLAMNSDKVGRGEAINIGGGKNHTINSLAQMVGGETTHIPPRPGEIRDTLADISLAKELLGWEPQVSLAEGIGILTQSDKLR